jgi:putative ABC transport system permease protein
VGIAMLIASPLAYFVMDRWLQNFAYKVPLTVPLFLLAGLSALLIALLTVGYQAIRAATSNPIENLRTE